MKNNLNYDLSDFKMKRLTLKSSNPKNPNADNLNTI